MTTKERAAEFPPVTLIEAGRSEEKYWRDVWRYRELLYFLAWRDVLVRYKQTAVGVTWVVLRPLLIMAIFTFAFGRVAKLPSDDGIPYSLMVLAGLLPWQFFSTALSDASLSLMGNANLITKVYFPRILIPLSAIATCIVDFLVTLALLVVFAIWFGVIPTWRIVLLPAFFALMVVPALGAGILLSALTVRYRDFRYVVPFIVQFGLYISPVGFSSKVIPDQFSMLFALNPMVGVIDGFRWALLGTSTSMDAPVLFSSCLISTLLSIVAVRYFRQTERSFADEI